jgi:hypothetical protein
MEGASLKRRLTLSREGFGESHNACCRVRCIRLLMDRYVNLFDYEHMCYIWGRLEHLVTS